MKQLIRNIIEEFGGREAGSNEEKQAQLFLKKHLDHFCNSTFIQEFDIPSRAKFESLKIFCTLYYITLALYWYNKPAALALSLVNAILFIGHFVVYYNWLDFLFPRKKSSNLIGVIEPGGEVKSTVIVSGHMDSAREFIWWWRLKQTGIVLTVLSGFLMALFPVFTGIDIFIEWTENSTMMSAAEIVYWLFVAASPITITMFNIHGKNVVPGAQDNLSGVAIAVAVGEYFSKQCLKNTRVKVISFGSEEIGLRGAEAYARKFNNELKNEKAVCINLDGIKDADQLTIIKSEPMILARYPQFLIAKLEASFNACGIDYKKLPLTVGGTDGVSMVRARIPAVTIIGQSMEKLDPTYHTRLDVPDCVDEKALEDTKIVVVHFIEEWDKEILN